MAKEDEKQQELKPVITKDDFHVAMDKLRELRQQNLSQAEEVLRLKMELFKKKTSNTLKSAMTTPGNRLSAMLQMNSGEQRLFAPVEEMDPMEEGQSRKDSMMQDIDDLIHIAEGDSGYIDSVDSEEIPDILNQLDEGDQNN